MLVAGGCFVLVVVGLIWAFLPDGGVKEFWNTTLGFQLHRTSPLSIWPRHPGIKWLRPAASLTAETRVPPIRSAPSPIAKGMG